VVVAVAEQPVVAALARVYRSLLVVVPQCLAEMNNEWWRWDLRMGHQRRVECHLRGKNWV